MSETIIMQLELHNNLELHHRILIILYLVTYFAAMLIQIKDPNTRVSFLDWILAFLASSVGGILTYFGVMGWANIGVRMATTIFVSLVSYRTLKFIVSDEAQTAFAKGFFSGLMGILHRLFDAPKKQNDDDDGRQP